MHLQELGRVIKALREQKGLTQEELAKKAKLTKPYISQLESGARGNPSVSAVKNLAKALRVPVQTLLSDEERRRILKLERETTGALTALPPAYLHFRDLFRVHAKQILKLDRKPPMHAATLLILVAYEVLSKLLGRTDSHVVFAENLVDRRQVPFHIGEVLYHALRNGLAHDYRPQRIVVDGQEILPTLTWKGGAEVHLKMIGVRSLQGRLRIVPVPEGEEESSRLCIVVEELWRDLDALFGKLGAELQADPARASAVETNARRVLVDDEPWRRPQGPALRVWREYVQRERWDRP
jgi:XRE family transcriptional regulator, master regulator for biofilm formation